MTAALIKGRPADDWPGIPGAGWGMGSRVSANLFELVGYLQDGRPIIRSYRRQAVVVGATCGGPEGYVIAVRLAAPLDGYWNVLPSHVRCLPTSD